jgi:hypothetical protein
MKHTLILPLLFLSLTSYSQKYLCRFTDSLGISNYSEQTASMKKSLREKGLPEEVIDAFIQKSFSSESDFLQIKSREISTRFDSTCVTLNYGSSNNSEYIGLTSNKYLVIRGVLYRFDSLNGTYILSNASDSSQIFIPLKKYKKILNYDCEEYISINGLYRIWVSHQLPSSINPWVSIKNVKGAILAFEARINNAFTRSIVNSIEVIKEVI